MIDKFLHRSQVVPDQEVISTQTIASPSTRDHETLSINPPTQQVVGLAQGTPTKHADGQAGSLDQLPVRIIFVKIMLRMSTGADPSVNIKKIYR